MKERSTAWKKMADKVYIMSIIYDALVDFKRNIP